MRKPVTVHVEEALMQRIRIKAAKDAKSIADTVNDLLKRGLKSSDKTEAE